MSSTRKAQHRFTKSIPYNSERGCPPGYHKRSAYRTSDGTFVPPRCVRATTRYAESSKQYKAKTLKKGNTRLQRHRIRSTTMNAKKVCPSGYILRKAYVRRYTTAVREKGYTVRKGNKTYRAYPTSGSTIVKAACVKDVGLKGKGEQKIGPLRKGELLKHGYSFRKSYDERHAALRKAAKEYGALGIYRKLNAVAKLSKRSAPDASKIFEKDRDWVRQTLGPLKAF